MPPAARSPRQLVNVGLQKCASDSVTKIFLQDAAGTWATCPSRLENARSANHLSTLLKYKSGLSFVGMRAIKFAIPFTSLNRHII